MNGMGLRAELRILAGFFHRRMTEFFSNRANAVFELAEMAMRVFTYGLLGLFVSRAGGVRVQEQLQGCPDYASFLMVGLLIHMLVWSARGNVSWLVRSREFPNLYMAPCHLVTLILGANAWKYVWICFQVMFFITISALLFGVRYHLNAGFALVVIGGMVLMTAFDMLGAAFRIITKSDEDPFNWTLSTSATVLSGQLFPVDVLPGWAQVLARFHPLYYVNTIARRTMCGGASLAEVRQELGLFLGLSLATLLLGALLFRVGFYRARVEGTLGHQ